MLKNVEVYVQEVASKGYLYKRICDLSTLDITKLFGKLAEHENELK